MIELKRVIAPIDDTPFDEICSFETDNYIGMFVDYNEKFLIMPKGGLVFDITFANNTNTLAELDEEVYNRIDEHIKAVSTSRCLETRINEEYLS